MVTEVLKMNRKIAHLVPKMGRENYRFGLTVSSLRATLWLNFVCKKEKEKPLRPGDQWPRENYILWSENE